MKKDMGYFITIPRWVYEKLAGRLYLLNTWVAIADFCDANGECFPSLKTIADKAKVSVSTIQRNIKELKELDMLEIFHRVDEDNGLTSNLYRLIFDCPTKHRVDTLDIPETIPYGPAGPYPLWSQLRPTKKI